MKKIILTLTFAILSIIATNAQSFGIKGGFNHTSLIGQTAEKSDIVGKRGFYAGIFLELPLGTIFAIQPELIYARQGAKWEKGGILTNGGTYEARLNMNYINVPIMAKIKIGNLGILGGPQFGFLIQKPEVEVPSTGGNYTIDKSAFGTFDFGIGIGADFQITESLLIDLRYTHGLTNTFDKNNTSLKTANISSENDFRNSALTLGLGIRF
ncbi:porin family protein [Capnocytophaga catalasegens]|uniref:Outer membrane protein beta-barrel domain-containing protein n=1 Tax=Capnocytophaga catalasegens TaxID=1004260 RepID=A0AAV5AUL5_9FLAO|nr:porin family protein [Capnocytophaga catalasegens]GIZ14856.1 hypothetical protein RCZ03_08560 [Capnocytophaga catalasegens]GJM49193.1 hypothetical protein RCZ15_01690 [Capnocytophaga catalasegens]GJM52595.1 hypothetical protein RCZ16_09120 [Capnocytophaga catalasegens]